MNIILLTAFFKFLDFTWKYFPEHCFFVYHRTQTILYIYHVLINRTPNVRFKDTTTQCGFIFAVDWVLDPWSVDGFFCLLQGLSIPTRIIGLYVSLLLSRIFELSRMKVRKILSWISPMRYYAVYKWETIDGDSFVIFYNGPKFLH